MLEDDASVISLEHSYWRPIDRPCSSLENSSNTLPSAEQPFSTSGSFSVSVSKEAASGSGVNKRKRTFCRVISCKKCKFYHYSHFYFKRLYKSILFYS